MDTPDAPELGLALLRWINSFEFTTPIESWKPLQDGHLLWKILVDVEPSFFVGSLPEGPSTASDIWIPRWQNLKHLNRFVTMFIRDECGKLPELSKRMNPDLKAIAMNASPNETLQLTKAVLLAALYSPESNQRMIGVMERLGTKVAIPIAACISQMESLDHKLAESAAVDVESDFERMSSPEPEAASAVNPLRKRDPELEREEKMIKAVAYIKELEDKSSSLTTELDAAREEIASLESNLTETKRRLEQGQASEAEDGEVEILRQRANRDKDSIAQLETEVADARAQLESQEKQLERLYQESESSQKLRDELHLIKNERDELRQKSKANENLKKKIQTLQDSDKSNQTLRQDLATAEQELQSLRPLKNRVAVLQKNNEENMKTIQNVEQEIFDSKTTRKRLEHELKMLTRQSETAKERQQRDQSTINELEEKLRDVESGQEGTAKTFDSLDDEFVAGDQAFNEIKAKNVELEAEIAKLRIAADNEQFAASDQSAYDLLKERFDKLEKEYLEVYQENLGLESAAKGFENGLEDSHPFVEMRDRLKAESEERVASEKRLFHAEAELTDLKLRLQSAEAKLSDKLNGDGEETEASRDFASSESYVLHKENTRLLQHIRTYEADLEEHRSLLRHALLDKNALVQQEKTSRFQEELKLVTEQLRAVVDDPKRTDDVALRVTQRIEDNREQITKAESAIEEQRQRHETQIEEMKAQAKRVAETAPAAAKNLPQENLQRELNLMTSAWYDVTRRLQSDAVVVERRGDTPRSFLNRQRRLLHNPAISQRR